MTAAVDSSHARSGFGGQSAALLLNTALNGILGVAFWLYAARLGSLSDVALAIAASSLLILLSFVTQLNLGTGLSRYLGGARASARGLVGYSYGAAMLCCGVVSAILILSYAIGGDWLLLGADWGFTLLVAAAVPLWTAFALQDNLLVAMHRASWIPIENSLAAVLRLVLLPLLVGAGASGILLAFVLPSVPAVVIVSWLCWRSLPVAPKPRPPVHFKKMLGFALIDLPGVLATTAALRIVPVLVLAWRGSDQAAFVGLPWTTLTVALLALSAVSLALLAQLAIPGVDEEAVLRKVHRLIFMLVPLCLVAAALVQPVLTLAGSKYASNGTPILAGGLLALIPAALTEIKIAQLRYAGRVPAAATVQVARALPLVVAACILAATDHLAWIGVALVVANFSSYLCGRWMLSAPSAPAERVPVLWAETLDGAA